MGQLINNPRRDSIYGSLLLLSQNYLNLLIFIDLHYRTRVTIGMKEYCCLCRGVTCRQVSQPFLCIVGNKLCFDWLEFNKMAGLREHTLEFNEKAQRTRYVDKS
jgi:hypothetical protein